MLPPGKSVPKGLGGRAARTHLAADPVLGPVVRQVGAFTLKPERREPYEALVRAIAHQQVHGRAAEAMLRRLIGLFPEHDFPPATAILTLEDGALRGCGFSGAKAAAIRDIAQKTVGGLVPTLRAATRLPDEELVQRLVALRGVGRWTVEMLLIFTLGRPDILPLDDFGVREGYRHAAGLDAQPKPKELAAIGAAWAPYRSAAAWYLWRAADLAKDGRFKAPTAL
ncbi:DNA-3-methyladenine glycosylase family protein [Roseomonas marmotae]|uniref:DNA-3-methyladenine glycosylase II n=1 Tax=Roseomonas marmotae TaxID=2768161 RepID=A0ABS3KA83_9PROT|nr:DNA-3-methyladenine glycosylase 2 family protein [Roseomonas marmotae]MBO1074352.1 DNA-3-methyladenine glycosylase 2 family protein [Roseomonas marmotae]QTI78101.1 DNA-3-methyladenine glycosylase 2 family protein [Roseomonas marmotae]